MMPSLPLKPAGLVRSLSWRKNRRTPREQDFHDVRKVEVYKVRRSLCARSLSRRCTTLRRVSTDLIACRFPVQMAGVARIGINLHRHKNCVMIASVTPDSPASTLVCKGDVLIAVNNEPVAYDPEKASKQIMVATAQCTSTGRLLPIQLTLGKLQVASPKGIEADFLDMRQPPLDVSEVTQSL
jgi:predicted metalloprotease with PDZ domain